MAERSGQVKPSRETIREYYRLITDVDIGEVARDLLAGRITAETRDVIHCDCPNHTSQSKRSLNVLLDKQAWYCFGCAVGGDVLQLVEFVRSGGITRGASGAMPESHRQARDFLAARVGLPPLNQYGLAPEKVGEIESARAQELRVFGALTALADYFHARLRQTPEVLAWFQSKYRISDETIDRLKIGFAPRVEGPASLPPGVPGPIATLTRSPEKYTLRELASTGAFRPGAQDGLLPFFDGRVVFPYWSRGRVVFMIGRKTPWTPDTRYEQGKYRKLPTRSPERNQHVAPFVENSHLYNEDCLLGRPKSVVVTEGVTDCISLMEHGFPAISPVAVRVRNDDWNRLLPKLAGVEMAYLCQDNEVSDVGFAGALQTAGVLAKHGIDTRIAILPLGPKQRDARRLLKERFDLDQGVDPRGLDVTLSHRSHAEIDEARRLLADAKIDVNEYFAGGASASDFTALLREAAAPIEFGIDRIPVDLPVEQRNRQLVPILERIAEQGPLEEARLLRKLQDRFGKKDLSLTDLRAQVRAIRAAQAKSSSESSSPSDAPEGSCRAAVEAAIRASLAERGSPDLAKAAEAAFNWFRANGAIFFKTPQKQPYIFFGNEIFWLDSRDPGNARALASFMLQQTAIAANVGGGRLFQEVFACLAFEHGELREPSSWIQTDGANRTVYFSLNNADQEIVRISPDGVQVLKNGSNEGRIILDGSPKMKPIRYVPDADPVEADRLLRTLLLENFACSPEEAKFALAWLSCFLLIDFAGTKPMVRFEGSTGSGKSTASKLFSVLLYGELEQKIGTVAANFSDGARNPFVLLDNVETEQISSDLLQFLLTAATGIAKEKRKGGTDTATVQERVKCLINSTGIEPLGGELAEVLSRSFVIRFRKELRLNTCFLEPEVVSEIQKNRDLILSVLIRRTSRVLAWMQEGAHRKVMRLLQTTLGDHSRSRANDFLGLMYLMMLAAETPEPGECSLEGVTESFRGVIRALDVVTGETARESNAIATALAALFRAFDHVADAEVCGAAADNKRLSYVAFVEKYQVQFTGEGAIEDVLARELFVSLKRVAREFGLAFPMTSVQQFAQRFSNDLETVRAAGFDVDVRLDCRSVRYYTIRRAAATSKV
jgi:hypothetical protein